MDREIPKDVQVWVAGRCYIAALALHRATGWEMRGLTAIRYEERGAQMAHAWVVDPEGNMWDAAGIIPPGHIDEFYLGGEKQHTVDSARHEHFPDEAAYMARHRELAGDWWDSCRTWFASMEADGEKLVSDLLIPRHPAIAAAAECHARSMDPFEAPIGKPDRHPEPAL